MPDSTLSTLKQIRIKVRRLTRSPSASQISDDSIDKYINTFVLYDFPEHLRTFSLKTTLVFYTEPFIDTYSGDNIVTNFDNLYTNVYDNTYIAGERQLFSQNREQFFALYTKIASVESIATGDGVTVNYTGTLTSILTLRNHTAFTSVATDVTGLEMHDVPNDPNDGTGTFSGDVGAASTLNYTTGVYDITFNAAPGDGYNVMSQYVSYAAGKPNAVLYYNNELTFRPVPDMPYRVELEVAARPTELLNDASMPELSQWWQYIAYGASKKIFEDRMDMDSVALIMSEFKQQETLINRRVIDQQTKERTATIYVDGSTAPFDKF